MQQILKSVLGLAGWFCFIQIGFGQIYTITPQSETAHIIDRQLILRGNQDFFHASIKNYDRRYLRSILSTPDASHKASEHHRDVAYLIRDNPSLAREVLQLSGSDMHQPTKNYIDSQKVFYRYQDEQNIVAPVEELRKPLFGIFYGSDAHMYELRTKDFELMVDPVINIKAYNSSEGILFDNQRGVLIRGSIDRKLYYYLSILETQFRPAQYVRDFESKYRALPGAGFYKSFKSTVFNSENSFDYFLAEGHLGMDITKHISMSFGHGRQFIGSGMRSLLLSDFSTNRLFLKIDTRVWKFHYQNIFAQLQLRGSKDDIGDQLIPNKYMAAHYLTFQLAKNFNIGVYESVIFSRPNQFELQYLNPLIFYRTIEGAIGSPDNVLIGLNADWSFLNHFQLYGQLILDEFKLDELIQKRRGWWGNKVGWQIGVKYINVAGIHTLDLQAELNSVRPYTYTHRDSTSSYTHYNQALAHPLGANFNELLIRLRYRPFKKWSAELTLMQALTPDDRPGQNLGSNILLPNAGIATERPFGNFIGQGISGTTFLAGADLSYRIFHNMYLDLRYFYRAKNSTNNSLERNESYFGGGIRINFDRTLQLF